ncbi:MAG: tetratricopeptide repeat-containing sulfotransferase family protein [Phycisphaerales bacterium]
MRALKDRDHPLLAEAISLWNRHDFERSLFTYERALAADPGNARIIINAARAFYRRNQPRNGWSLLQSLIHAMPEDRRVHLMVGQTLRLLSLPSAAIIAFETARTLGDRTVQTALELAALYEQAGRLDDAEPLVEEALASDPASAWAGLLRGRMLSRRKRFEEAAEAFRALAQRVPADSETASEAWADLAAVLDAMGDPAGASDAIERCKAPQRAADAAAWQAALHVTGRIESMIKDLTAEHTRAWNLRAGDHAGRCPVALLCGFPRSGTTLLEQIVDAHPQVRSVEERDVLAGEIFPTLVHGRPADAPILPILDGLPKKQIGRVRGRYVAALRDWHAAANTDASSAHLDDSTGTVTLDKNPGATPLIPVLRALFPSAPLLVAVRDPRDVVLSCYLRYLRLNPVSVHFLTIERTAAKYAMDMGAWLRLRDRYPSGWIQVRYEDLISDIEGTTRRVLETLNLDWNPGVLNYRDRLSSKIVTSPTYARVREPVTRAAIGRWSRYQSLLAPALPVLEPFVKAFGYP